MRHDQSFLLDIAQAAKRILEFKGDMAFEAFLSDEKTQSSIIHQLLIIGEATKLLSGEFKSAHPHIPWQAISRMRDKLIHHYHGVDLQEVWDTCQSDIPELIAFLEPFLPEE